MRQAALGESLELLVARDARADIPDTLWHATPLVWAIHNGKTQVRGYLERPAGSDAISSPPRR